MEYLFVCGTLKDSRVQASVLGRYCRGAPDLLVGYRAGEIYIDGKKYPTIVPDPFGSVTGVILSLDPGELKLVDLYEGDKYRRKMVKMRSGKEAWVYLR